VAFVSDPLSPLHFHGGTTPELGSRLASYLAGGARDCGGRLWSYVPAALLTPHRLPLLRGRLVHRGWQHLTWPNVVSTARRRGFGRVDLLYIDSVHQNFWLDALDYGRAVYRLTDFSPHFGKWTAQARSLEEDTARRVDLVVYPSPELRGYAEGLGARRTLCLPNGVEYESFAAPQPPPPEYRALRGPVAVYVGIILEWFHFVWVRHAAARLPDMQFVLIGPDALARRELGGLANVHVLGPRPYAAVPAYLQHADVGIIPFDVAKGGDTVDCLNPLKFYQYLACGLPVVSAEWTAIRRINSPARLCRTADEFAAALRRAADDPGDRDAYRRYAAAEDWGRRAETLLQALDDVGRVGDFRAAA
jgi:glycosyltransferase involved in cell wall biosynthesis